MYRFFKLPNTNYKKFSHLPLYQYRSSSDQICNHCNKLHLKPKIPLVPVRQQSSYPSPYREVKRPSKRKMGKYADMMIVKNETVMEIKSKIQNLNPEDIRLLALSNIHLHELHKLKTVLNGDPNAIPNEHSYSNLADITNIERNQILDIKLPVMKPIEEELNEVEEEEESLLNIKKDQIFQPETETVEEVVEIEEPPKSTTTTKRTKKVKRVLHDSKYREESIARKISAYMDVCSFSKQPQKGITAFYYYKNRSTNTKKTDGRYPKITRITVFNSLLKAYAAKGDFGKVQEILRYLQEAEVKLNEQSYAAIFECLARVNCNDSHTRFIRMYTREALVNNISFDSIMNKATFLYDQREKVLEAMRAHKANYEPVYDKPILQYNNNLVDSLNDPTQLYPPEIQSSNADALISSEELQSLAEKQLQMEKNVLVEVKTIEARSEPSEEVTKYRKIWDEHIKLWEKSAQDAFNRDLISLTAHRSHLNYDMYLRSVPSKDIVAIIVDEAKKLAQGSETYSPTVSLLYRDLGERVYARYKVLLKEKTGVLEKIMKVHNEYLQLYAASHKKNLGVLPEPSTDFQNSRQKWQWNEYKFQSEGATIEMDHSEWTLQALTVIGKFLYNIIMHDLKIDVNCLRLNSKHKNYLPAFYTIFRSQRNQVKEEVKPHPVLWKLNRSSMPETLTFPAYELPMYCPPVPWTSHKNGGYLIAPCDVVRLPTNMKAQLHRLEQTPPEQMSPSLDSLNQLGAVPWKVNRRILETITEVFRAGGDRKLDVPENPVSLEAPPSATAEMSKSERYTLFRQRLQYKRKRSEMYSIWCDCLYRLSLANHFKYDIFWLPHNMDFRGRVYPVPPHLNHLGSDLARSMLIFAEGRPLGPDGLDWLKIHLINLTGLLKRERVCDRLQFANEIMDKILDSADNPLTGAKWWAESEEPWQTLACCMEIAAAYRSGNPENYVCHFPVHQDGSCNGLQHYAALGRDEAGAFSVNLKAADRPQDVYNSVANLVEQKREEDAANGVQIAQTLKGFVRRKVIKQTVMTTVYGVTRFGARLQIAKQLKDLDDFPKDAVWAGSTYLTHKTFESLRSMFESTKEIQDWFTECARLISSVVGQNVEWVTPMGLPIVQPYCRFKTRFVETVEGASDKIQKPNVMKQKNAFPPNFIHSLDSSHMMLTSLYCERAGITFVSVHDCYWTHPSTVHIMNKICRNQFVALHSQPILKDLSNFLSEKYSYDKNSFSSDGSVMELTRRKLNRILKKLPQTGTFDIENVKNSVYFFS